MLGQGIDRQCAEADIVSANRHQNDVDGALA
jgi:hypothetical protein